MVEVFKTNVKHRQHANMLLSSICQAFPEYKANFDLEDCDNILRIKTPGAPVDAARVIRLLEEHGFLALVLPDTVILG